MKWLIKDNRYLIIVVGLGFISAIIDRNVMASVWSFNLLLAIHLLTIEENNNKEL